jgi:hypothetical protein
MPGAFADRVYFSTATVGTGDIAVGAAIAGFRTPAQAGLSTQLVSYAIEDGANYEVGRGTLSAAGATMSRAPLASSNAGAAIALSGAARVLLTAIAADLNEFALVNQDTTGSAGTLNPGRNIDGQLFNGAADITVIAPGTHAAAGKPAPVDADELPLVDSAASNGLKKLTWANLKAALNSYFGGLYLPLTGGSLTGGLSILPAADSNANIVATATGAGVVSHTFTGDSVVQIIMQRNSDNATGVASTFRKRRGTQASPSDIVLNDSLGFYRWAGRLSGTDTNQGQLEVIATAATPSSSARDARMVVTLGTGATFSEIARLDHATGLSMFGANVVIDQTRHHVLRQYTVATLPASATLGALAMVTDAGGTITYRGAPTSGGSTKIMVMFNGVAWEYH